MFDNKQKIMERVAGLPKGAKSESGRYWCVTCKMLFDMEEPVCPYMPKMCINTPIPVELLPLESSIALEKLGLFYPKVPQKVIAHLADTDAPVDASGLVSAYLSFLDDWGVDPLTEPLQTLKSFIILLSGCETAQRVAEDDITFVVTDVARVWDKERLVALLERTLPLLARRVGIGQAIHVDDIDLLGDKPSGRYFCPMCRKFFEFSSQKDFVTCPLMSQKCMAKPSDIAQSKYTLADLAHVYEVTPDFTRRFVTVLPAREDARALLETLLREEWGFSIEPEPLERIAAHLGV